jgi:C1A family cysteine protease
MGLHRYNRIPDLRSIHDTKYALHPETKKKVTLPPADDLTDEQSPVVDQGNLGSCTGNADAGAEEFLQLMEIKENIPLNEAPEIYIPGEFCPVSRLFIYWNERAIEGTTDQDSGASISDGMKALTKWGVCRESVWPYDIGAAFTQPTTAAFAEAEKHKLRHAYRINDGDLTHMKTCIYHGFPFVFGITVYESFESAQATKTGVIPMPQSSESVLGGHAILAVAYDDSTQLVKFKNSWGTSWGQSGYGFLPYAYISNTDLTSDIWTLRFQP